MAVKGKQKDDKTTTISNIGMLVTSVIAYVIFSFAACYIVSVFVQNYLMIYIISFTVVGIGYFLGMHFILPMEMSRVDARLLHEMAKRKLIEFEPVDDEQTIQK